jgi:endonuclease-8
VPEGDTIHYAANRIRPVLEGQVPDAIETPHPRFGADRWPERLGGREVEEVSAYGKHLFLRFAGDLTIHSHLRMTGSWGVFPPGRRWHRARRRAWLIITKGTTEVVEFDGPVLELITETRRRFDRRLAMLGPDIVAEGFDEQRFLRRLREDDPTRPIGDALLDQRTVAGIGNLWKVEACFAMRIDPWRQTAQVTDEEALSLVRWARPNLPESARTRIHDRYKGVFNRAGRPGPRCGTIVRKRGQWDDNRPTAWCPGCQR